MINRSKASELRGYNSSRRNLRWYGQSQTSQARKCRKHHKETRSKGDKKSVKTNEDSWLMYETMEKAAYIVNLLGLQETLNK